MTVQDIIHRSATLYNDLEYVRVPIETYLKFLDDAISQLITFYPEAHSVTSIVPLKNGIKQDIPEDGISLIEITRSVVLDPLYVEPTITKSYPIMLVEKKDLDSSKAWGNDEGKEYISNYAFDTLAPYTFWVYPPVGATPVNVEMIYSQAHEKFGDRVYEEVQGTVLNFRDNYLMPLVYYMLYLLYSTDSSSQLDKELANMYFNMFGQQIQTNKTTTVTVGPKLIEPDTGISNAVVR